MTRTTFATLGLLVVFPLSAAEYSATVTWAEQSVLGVPVSGVVQTVHVRRGERVEKGQALVTLDDRRFQARVDEAQAHVDGALPELDEAKRELERAKDLYERTVLSDHELRLAELGVSKADAKHRIAAAGLTRAKLALEHSVLRAPFAGLVLEQQAQRGQVVVSRFQSVPLVVLASTDALLARAELERGARAGIEIDQEVDLTLGENVMKGLVHAISADPAAGSDGKPRYRIDVRFQPPSDLRILAGDTVVLRLP